MPLPNFKLSQLRMLAAVAEHGNFGKAGLSLDVSQSAISHAVASLEEELGVVLIQRGRHGAHLTPIGKEILAHVQQILSLSDTIVQTANVARGLEGGTVQIASFRSFATHVLPPILAQFQEHYPAIHVKIHELSLQKEVEDSIRTGKADIGLLHLPVDETFDSWEFLKDEYKVFAPSHVALSADSLTWSELLQHPIILPPANDSCSQIVREHFEEQHQALNVTYEIKEASTAISMVAQGLGIAILANLVAQPVPETIQIYSLPVKLERLAGYAVRQDALHSPAVYAFIEALQRNHPSRLKS